jgi:hypothetical protein
MGNQVIVERPGIRAQGQQDSFRRPCPSGGIESTSSNLFFTLPFPCLRPFRRRAALPSIARPAPLSNGLQGWEDMTAAGDSATASI